jgi:hypothetical protein
MSQYRFDLATPADDADLRRVLAQTPMPGPFAVSFRREPSYFAAAGVDGRFRQVVAARDCTADRVVGFGSRTISERFINGRPESIGYLGGLRLLAAHRNRGLVARGFAYFRRLHADGRARLYLTTIAERNEPALRILTSGRAGLPTYHFAGCYHTATLPLRAKRGRGPFSGRTRKRSPSPFCTQVRAARIDDVPEILAFLTAVGPRRQFFPCYRAEDFFGAEGALRDLEPADLLLAFRAGQLVGTLAAWDQHSFRQTVVDGYPAYLGWTRVLYNGWARWTGRPRLPPPGSALRYLTAALPVVADDDADVFAALLDALLVRGAEKAGEYVLLGLHEADPLLRVVRNYRAVWYTTQLYLVCWEDGEQLRASLDSRPPYLELGSL